jgi:hypothetical protein
MIQNTVREVPDNEMNCLSRLSSWKTDLKSGRKKESELSPTRIARRKIVDRERR